VILDRARPMNPVLMRELKERLRTRRATIVITVYLAVLAAIVSLVYVSVSAATDSAASLSATLGRSLFELLLFCAIALVCFIVPGLTADAVTGERERQTLVPLQVTLLPPRSILLGKLAASVAFVSLLVVATMPLLGVSFLLGGVSAGALVRGVLAVLAIAVILATFALGCSSIARRTQGATVLAYAVTAFLIVGTPLVYGGQAAFAARDGDAGEPPGLAVLVLNPFLATADAVGEGAPEDDPDRFVSPFSSIRRFIADQEDGQDEDTFVGGVRGGGVGGGGFVEDGGEVGGFVEAPDVDATVEPTTTVPPAGEVATTIAVEPVPAPFEPAPAPGQDVVLETTSDDRSWLARIPFWLRSLGVLGWLAALAFWMAARRLRAPSVLAAS